MAGMTILLPTPEAQVKGTPLAPRLSSLRGKRVGFINNQWYSMNLTFEVFEEMLYEKHDISGVVKKLTQPGVPLTKDEFQDLAGKVDAVITGLGN